jgi:hypothetical protein
MDAGGSLMMSQDHVEIAAERYGVDARTPLERPAAAAWSAVRKTCSSTSPYTADKA